MGKFLFEKINETLPVTSSSPIEELMVTVSTGCCYVENIVIIVILRAMLMITRMKTWNY
jgi:hypothetical protein